MKKVIFFSVFLLLIVGPAQASEITGRISTVSGSLTADTASNSTSGNASQTSTTNQNSQTVEVSPVSTKNKTQTDKSAKQNSIAKKTDTNKISQKKIKVLGVSFYPDGSLLRADGRRVFLTRKGFRKPILSLKDLKKYSGQTIFNVTNEELAQYPVRPNLEGELIREKGQPRIFVIVEGKKIPIISLAELRSKYRNYEISNISHEEMNLF